MNLGIAGKIALVTGAGRGLGAGICASLSREGVAIVACSRTEGDLDGLLADLAGTGHRAFAVDLEAADGPSALVAFLESQGLSPDIVVNNVGGNLSVTDPLVDLDSWRRVMRLNVEVALELNQSLIPAMRERRWGRVCHVSSISALENQGPPAYCAAKAALNAYVRSTARFVAPDNVVMTAVMPGAVLTEGGYWDVATTERPDHVARYLEDRMAIKRFGEAGEVSELVAFLCSEHASFCIGTNVLVDGGQGRVFYPAGA